jgi:hypothetical protein
MTSLKCWSTAASPWSPAYAKSPRPNTNVGLPSAISDWTPAMLGYAELPMSPCTYTVNAEPGGGSA